jgi:hypothetical protein
VPLHHRPQIFRLLANGPVPASSQLFFHCPQLRLHPFAHRPSQHHEASRLPGLPAAVRESKEVEGLGLSLSSPIAIADGEPTKLDQSGLFRVQLQAELGKALLELHEELLALVAMLEPNDEVIGVAHHDYLSARLLLPPPLGPQIEHVVQVARGKPA